jgi:Arc/MetJ-type ribon-helix-helix transcriptional regulator
MKREKQHDTQIGLRLPAKERAEIQLLIDQGKYLNISQLIRAALQEFLKNA